MAAIYDKALKRQDYSGIINKDKQEEAMPSRDEHDRDLKSTPFPFSCDEIMTLFQTKRKTKRKLRRRRKRNPTILKLELTLARSSTLWPETLTV